VDVDMVYASDYPTAAAYRAALIKEFNTVGDLHLIRAQYQLERECQLQDTFAALQQYQQSTGVQLIDTSYSLHIRQPKCRLEDYQLRCSGK